MTRFWKEEDGFGVVEVVLIMAIVVAAAIIFRNLLLPWIKARTENVLSPADNVVSDIPDVQTVGN